MAPISESAVRLLRASSGAGGNAFIQQLQFRARYGGFTKTALDEARNTFGPTAAVTLLIEKALSAADLGAEALRAASQGFVELVRARSLIGRIQNWRRVAFHTPTLQQTAASQVSWVEEGHPKPVTLPSFEPAALARAKLAGIVILTNEVLRGTGEGFTRELEADLVAAVAAMESRSLIDPAESGTPGVQPASLTYGVAPIVSSGADGMAVREDLGALVDAFVSGGGDLETAALILSPRMALRLTLMQETLGDSSLTVRGGTLFGIPAFASTGVPDDSTGSVVALIDPARILLAEDGVDINLSNQATIEESGNAGAFSLFQRNCSGVLVDRFINWRASTGAVQWLSGVHWGEAQS